MTNMTKRRIARTTLVYALGGTACVMASFFDDPNPWVAVPALVAWCCLLVAIFRVTA